jgi:hypothetical protein
MNNRFKRITNLGTQCLNSFIWWRLFPKSEQFIYSPLGMGAQPVQSVPFFYPDSMILLDTISCFTVTVYHSAEPLKFVLFPLKHFLTPSLCQCRSFDVLFLFESMIDGLAEIFMDLNFNFHFAACVGIKAFDFFNSLCRYLYRLFLKKSVISCPHSSFNIPCIISVFG